VLEKADSQIKFDLGQCNGKIATFLDAYRMNKIVFRMREYIGLKPTKRRRARTTSRIWSA
jgi:hypothetical protein